MRTDPRIRFWRSDSPSVAGMVRVEREDRLRVTYSPHFVVAAVCAGAFDGWYRGRVRTNVAGAIKLKEPGEVHRDIRVHEPFTLQIATFAPDVIETAAAALGRQARFRAVGFAPGERGSRLAFAMHAALDGDVPALARETAITELLDELLDDGGGEPQHATRAVRLARAALHDSMAERITLDELATHAGLDKFHLVRAFRAEIGIPPYEYLMHVRIAAARELLQRGARVAEAAVAVGYYDESQLHRHFRRIVGIAPGVFARQHRPSTRDANGADSPHDTHRRLRARTGHASTR